MLRELPIVIKKLPLSFLPVYRQYVVRHKIITPSIYFITMLKLALIMVASIDLIINGQIELFFKKYSLSFCMSFYVVAYLSLEYFCFTGSKSDEIMKLEWFWTLEMATLPTRKKMNTGIRVIYLRCIFILLSYLALALLSIFIGFCTDSSLYPEKIFLRKVFAAFPKIELFLEFFVNISQTLWIALTSGLIISVEYISNLLYTQLRLLSDFVKQIELYEIPDDTNIEKHLKKCCTHHVSICRYFHNVQSLCFIPIAFIIPTAIVYFVGCIVCVYYSVNYFDILQVSGILVLATLVLIIICDDAQNIQDAFEQLWTHLVETKWYNWNETNKKILLMMIIRSQKEECCEALTLRINRALIIRVIRMVYQLFLVIQSTM